VIQAAARQPRATGIMIFDEAMYSEVADLRIIEPGTGASEREKFAVRERLEGEVLIKADTIEGLADALAQCNQSVVSAEGKENGNHDDAENDPAG
jgi:hypothetical protein